MFNFISYDSELTRKQHHGFNVLKTIVTKILPTGKIFSMSSLYVYVVVVLEN